MFPTLSAAQIARIAGHGLSRPITRREVLIEGGQTDVPFFVLKACEIEAIRPSGLSERFTPEAPAKPAMHDRGTERGFHLIEYHVSSDVQPVVLATSQHKFTTHCKSRAGRHRKFRWPTMGLSLRNHGLVQTAFAASGSSSIKAPYLPSGEVCAGDTEDSCALLVVQTTRFFEFWYPRCCAPPVKRDQVWSNRCTAVDTGVDRQIVEDDSELKAHGRTDECKPDPGHDLADRCSASSTDTRAAMTSASKRLLATSSGEDATQAPSTSRRCSTAMVRTTVQNWMRTANIPDNPQLEAERGQTS
jgi:hypothetical protein